jgi:hypothetical protein
MRKHVNSDHYKKKLNFEKEVNSPLREDKRLPFKKRPNISSSSIPNFFATK